MFTDELLGFLFSGQRHLLAAPMAMWLASSRRFAAFVTTYRDKIRKKLRVTQDEESLLDLRLELETAYLLLQERSLSVAYEPQQSGPGRSPDFAVSFTTRFTFMVEVTRLRAEAQEQALAETVAGKMSQLLPQHSHVLLIGVEALRLTADELRGALLRLQQRAERDDAAFLRRHGLRDRAGFFNHYQRLSEVLVRGPQPGEPIVAWTNPQAKLALPSRVRTALHHSQAG
jgi:hypothetical protein